MNYAVNTSNLLRPRDHRRSLQLLTANDVGRLEIFYLGLDFDNRRRRFGGGKSDESVARYCRSIDWSKTVIVTRGSNLLLDAVLELHPISENWDCAEVSLSCPLDCNRTRIFAELFQLAALTAGARGCSKFLFYRNAGCSDAIDILNTIGQCSCDGDVLSVDISEYATKRDDKRSAGDPASGIA